MSQIITPGNVVQIKPEGIIPGSVCIVVCAGDGMKTDTAMRIAAMMTVAKNVVLLDIRSSLIPIGRNMAVEKAKEFRTEWLFFLDSDMVFPKEALQVLLSRNQKIVGASYPKRVPPHPMLYRLLPGETRVEVETGIHEVMGLPTGCLLIHMSVFDKLKRPYFQAPGFDVGDSIPRPLREMVSGMKLPDVIGEDYFFCAMARAAGFKIYLDIDLTKHIGHIGQQIWYAATEEDELAKPTVGATR